MWRLLPVIVLAALFLAARPVSPPASLSLNEPTPHLGQVVTFSYTLPEKAKECDTYPNSDLRCAFINVLCYQGGQVVYGENQGVKNNAFLLGGGWSAWLNNGGPAECTASLQTGKAGILTIISFHSEGAP